MMMIPQPKPRNIISGIVIKKAPVPLPRRQSSIRKPRCQPIFESSSLTPSEIADMSARAIAAARSRTNTADSRPLSAYEETAAMSMHRRRASIAVLPMVNERTLSPEFGAIRVQVEDITTNTENMQIEDDLEVVREAEDDELFEDLGETSTETLTELNQSTGADSEGYMRREEMSVADWAVPSEYASSPIVVALSESENDERPRPKIPAVYMNTSISNENGNYSDFVSRRNSSISSSTISNGKSVTLLEQIIRTHAIWYLSHLGRPEVLHLLKRMEPGNFIVRASTRENCMALSMRLPPGTDMETDHYIIEKIQLPATAGSSNSTNVVRLEGSPRTFRSLPLLIEHYCVNDEELLIRLQLPKAIRNCTTTKQLQSISLMQQEFWTSDMSLSRKPSRSLSRCSMASRDSSDTLRRMEHASTWFMSDNNEIGGRSDDLKNNNETSDGLLIKMPPKKKRSCSRGTNSSNSRFATVCVGDFTRLNGEDETDSCGSSGLSQGYSRPDLEASPSISRIERRSQSVRSHKSVTSTKSNTNTVSRPKSFLRSLLSFGTTKESPGIAKKQIDSTPQEYFAPWDQGFGRQVRSSRSAFDITQPPPTRGFLNAAPAPRSPRKHIDTFDDENYTKGWKESAEVKSAKASPGGRSIRSESMKTFKPIYDVPSSSTGRPNLRPLTLRHDGTVETLTNGMSSKNNGSRLAFHNESSPGPARVPMTPPINGNDPQMIQNCVEELRRKRLQSTNEMLTPSEVSFTQTHSANATPQISMRRRNNGYPSPSGSNRAVNGYAGINKHNRNSDHRLSVPNLIAATNPLIPKHADRNDEVMTTINEGLVTPLVRRKMFISAQKSAHQENRHSKMIAEVEGVAVGAGEVAKRREVLEAIIDKRKQQDKRIPSSSSTTSTSSSSGAESELIWRRANKQYQNLEKRQQKIAKVLPTPQPRVRHIMAAGVISLQPAMDSNNDYAQLSDLDSARSIMLSKRIETDDDAVSVAGTVFNEPWDSNVWENLLDLAHHGDESELGLKVSEPIQEEEDNAMDSEDDDDLNEEEEEMRWPSSEDMHQRKLPSDRVTVKGWEQHQQQQQQIDTIKYSTLDSRGSGGRREETFSVKSLPRTLSRFSHAALGGSFGSIDDLPTTLPSMSPLLGGGGGMRRIGSVTKNHGIGKNVQNYVEQLAQVRKGDNACFGLTLRQFIACTKDTKESDPSVVVRNVRQFINGMKNYLVKHGEGDLHRIIDDESARLTSNQILNIDAVLEAILHKLLLKEVKPLLYHVMVKEHSKSGTLQLISTNIAIVRKMNLKQLGFSNAENLITPSTSTLEQIKLYMRKMQSHYSPLKKLENLMNAVSLILACQTDMGSDNEHMNNMQMRGLPTADDLVRWLVYILARTSTVGCEVEAWYMWELLPQPILMQSDASYYLTALFSAIHVLKSAEAIRRLCDREEQVTMTSLEISRTCCSSPLLSTATLTRGARGADNGGSNGTTPCDAFVKIAVPDETIGCVRYTTFPGVPLLTTSKLNRLIAHQQGITNPEEHGLYLIADGFESCLQANDCPVMIHEQLKKENKPHLFAYKRHEAKIAWPRTAISTY